ncbi:hypothetical protein GPL15_09770 [Clostridium sp. MCC353]|uniref:helix-turn-helix transcriptional regulator n=1 Tax=Clostridium sp. MCC353 TaxID=2592646 RepID=UPI001C039F15|nr:PAS domain-containing protein [Clostridium sp. MCC353]MBT9776789.1 hypothetical protein [Clostridium sp. MCC353]
MNHIILTEEDRKILESYKTVIDGLAAYLGSSYEIALHSLEDLEHSVIKIVNGFHTGRSEGSPITDLALFWLEKIESENGSHDYYEYFSKNKLGEPLKSTTIAVRGSENRIIGLICINLYLGTPLIHFISDMIPEDKTVFATETFTDNPNDTIKQGLENAKEIVLNDKTIPPSQRKKEIIRILQMKKIFEIKNSVEQIANELNISVNTVYFHLRNIAKQEGSLD